MTWLFSPGPPRYPQLSLNRDKRNLSPLLGIIEDGTKKANESIRMHIIRKIIKDEKSNIIFQGVYSMWKNMDNL